MYNDTCRTIRICSLSVFGRSMYLVVSWCVAPSDSCSCSLVKRAQQLSVLQVLRCSGANPGVLSSKALSSKAFPPKHFHPAHFHPAHFHPQHFTPTALIQIAFLQSALFQSTSTKYFRQKCFYVKFKKIILLLRQVSFQLWKDKEEVLRRNHILQVSSVLY